MNKVLFLALIALAAAGPLIAQDRHQKAPASVQRSFQKDYPEARNAQWGQTNGQWHANFEDHSSYDRGEMVAHYDQSGHHVDSHIPYDRNDVPPVVVDRVQKSYPGASNHSYTRIEHPGQQPLFQVSLNLHGANRTTYVDDHGRERKYNDHH